MHAIKDDGHACMHGKKSTYTHIQCMKPPLIDPLRSRQPLMHNIGMHADSLFRI